MWKSHGWYSFSDVEIKGLQHYIQYMITSNKQLVLEALEVIWTTKTRNYHTFNGPQYARAVYLRYFNGLKLHEIAAELNISTERARQCVERGKTLIKQRLRKRYQITSMTHALDA